MRPFTKDRSEITDSSKCRIAYTNSTGNCMALKICLSFQLRGLQTQNLNNLGNDTPNDTVLNNINLRGANRQHQCSIIAF